MEFRTLNALLSGPTLEVPEYQRGYAWVDDQVRAFWDDLVRLPHGHQHFAGMLVLERVNGAGGPLRVVDGQQRITTAVILLRALLDAAAARGGG